MSQYIIYVVLHFWNYYPRVELTAATVAAAFIGCVCFCTFDYGQMQMRSFPAWQFYGDVESDGVVMTAKNAEQSNAFTNKQNLVVTFQWIPQGVFRSD